MSSTVEQIKDRLSIVDVIGGSIKLEKAGSSYKARCPFHHEKTPSFFVSPNRGTFYCFGCGMKGDMFTFVEQFEGTDFLGALKTLAARAGVEIVKENPTLKSEKDKLYEIMEEASRWFESNLTTETAAREYLLKRGLNQASFEKWRLGFAPKEWRALGTHLSSRGYTQGEMEKAGLIKKSDDGKTVYDRFRGRIQFPIFDSSGRIVAFSGRILNQEENEPKYLNSPETPIFTKSKVLYGFDKAKDGMRKFGYSILVEGQMDLVMSHQVGLTNVVATSGTALSFEQIELVRRLSSNMILAYDGDAAGLKAAYRASVLTLAQGMEVKIALFPDGQDPADIARHGLEVIKAVIKESNHVITFFAERAVKEATDGRVLARRVTHEVLPLVSLIESSVVQSHFISEISKMTRIKDDALWKDLAHISRDSVLAKAGSSGGEEIAVKVGSERVAFDRKDFLEQRLTGVILWLKTTKSPARDPDTVLKEWDQISGGSRGSQFLKNIEEEAQQRLIFEAEAYYDTSQVISEDISRLLNDIHLEYLKAELAGLIIEIDKVEREHDHLKAMSLLKRSQDVSKKINEIQLKERK